MEIKYMTLDVSRYQVTYTDGPSYDLHCIHIDIPVEEYGLINQVTNNIFGDLRWALEYQQYIYEINGMRMHKVINIDKEDPWDDVCIEFFVRRLVELEFDELTTQPDTKYDIDGNCCNVAEVNVVFEDVEYKLYLVSNFRSAKERHGIKEEYHG